MYNTTLNYYVTVDIFFLNIKIKSLFEMNDILLFHVMFVTELYIRALVRMFPLVIVFSNIFSSVSSQIITSTFQIGIGGSIETHGSLLDMPNQTFHITGKRNLMVIDTPTWILCNSIKYGETVFSFCPDPYLYAQWEYLFKQLMGLHSFIQISNLPTMSQNDLYVPTTLKLDCPKGGTILVYGDSRCQIDGLYSPSKRAQNQNECQRLIPMVLASGARIKTHKVYVPTSANSSEYLYIPCISPMYICGFGPQSTNIKFTERTVAETDLMYTEVSNVNRNFFRNSMFDCLTSSTLTTTFEDFRDHVLAKPIYNITDFNIRLKEIERNASYCLGEKDGQDCSSKCSEHMNSNIPRAHWVFCDITFTQTGLDMQKTHRYNSLRNNLLSYMQFETDREVANDVGLTVVLCFMCIFLTAFFCLLFIFVYNIQSHINIKNKSEDIIRLKFFERM